MKTNIIQWIIDTPFNRTQYSSVTNGRVDYSGYLYNNKGEDMTIEEYLSSPLSGARYKSPRIVSDDEFMNLYRDSVNSLKTMFKEITEERYMDALECLPPMKWRDITSGVNVFLISEAFTDDLHSTLLHDRTTGKYYEALRSKFETNEELLDLYLKSK